jgi:Cof subfamily protein (haloacid dehalogenase superfamily)
VTLDRLPPVVASDLDGTLIRSDGTISDRSRAAIAAAEDSGALVVLVTGRPPRWMAPVVEMTGHHGLAVCANGAYVFDLHRGTIVEEHLLDPTAAHEVVTALRQVLPDVAFATETGMDFRREHRYRPRWANVDDAPVDDVSTLLDQPVGKLLARVEGTTNDAMYGIATSVVDPALGTVTHSGGECLLEISGAGVSKASTLERLCARHGFDGADAVAFGDMPNDIPMLLWAGYAVAVANAHRDVLAVVDEVSASNDDDGVAVVLERCLGRETPQKPD